MSEILKQTFTAFGSNKALSNASSSDEHKYQILSNSNPYKIYLFKFCQIQILLRFDRYLVLLNNGRNRTFDCSAGRSSSIKVSGEGFENSLIDPLDFYCY
jgi:hypothetical protein